tara:strand:- start:777 stop:1013 length:237 start_codon:yes stop_codon:yes gene_type:complete
MPKPTKEERLAHDTMQRNGGYPEHDDLIEKMMDIVAGNIENNCECQHGRETLDDVIADLKQYRGTLATPEQYHEKGLL